jgi:hypothetical protein
MIIIFAKLKEKVEKNEQKGREFTFFVPIYSFLPFLLVAE